MGVWVDERLQAARRFISAAAGTCLHDLSRRDQRRGMSAHMRCAATRCFETAEQRCSVRRVANDRPTSRCVAGARQKKRLLTRRFTTSEVPCV
jgi:hypothetical protein